MFDLHYVFLGPIFRCRFCTTIGYAHLYAFLPNLLDLHFHQPLVLHLALWCSCCNIFTPSTRCLILLRIHGIISLRPLAPFTSPEDASAIVGVNVSSIHHIPFPCSRSALLPTPSRHVQSRPWSPHLHVKEHLIFDGPVDFCRESIGAPS